MFYASSEMDPEMPWLERSPNFPAEASCVLIVHITRWKDIWVPCRDPRKALGLHFISIMGLTCLWQLESHVEFTASNYDDAWQFFNILRNPNITVSNRKRDHILFGSESSYLISLLYCFGSQKTHGQMSTWLYCLINSRWEVYILIFKTLYLKF